MLEIKPFLQASAGLFAVMSPQSHKLTRVQGLAELHPEVWRLSGSLVEFLEQCIEVGFKLGVIPAGRVGFDVLEQFQGVVSFAAAM